MFEIFVPDGAASRVVRRVPTLSHIRFFFRVSFLVWFFFPFIIVFALLFSLPPIMIVT